MWREREKERNFGGPAESGPAEGGLAEGGSAEGGPAEGGPREERSWGGGCGEGVVGSG